jgi:hypothetical protein
VRANNAPLESKEVSQPLPHLWDPPPKIESPVGSASHGAPENDRLGGTIKKINTPPTVHSTPGQRRQAATILLTGMPQGHDSQRPNVRSSQRPGNAQPNAKSSRRGWEWRWRERWLGSEIPQPFRRQASGAGRVRLGQRSRRCRAQTTRPFKRCGSLPTIRYAVVSTAPSFTALKEIGPKDETFRCRGWLSDPAMLPEPGFDHAIPAAWHRARGRLRRCRAASNRYSDMRTW